jgi:TRAP-type C4-dicarboxylate transport system permease small subunit
VIYKRSSIAIEFGGEWIEKHFGSVSRRIVQFAADLSTAAFFSVAAYQMMLLMLNSKRAGEVTATLKFPLWVAYGCSSAFMVVAAVTALVIVFRTSHVSAGVVK